MTQRIEPQELLAFLEANKREPSLTGALPGEPQLARWLLNQRSYYRRTGSVNQEAEAFLDANGFLGILRRNRRETRSSQMTQMLVAWLTQNGSGPREDAEDPGESYLGAFLARKRSKGTRTRADLQIVSDAGYPNIFDTRDRVSASCVAAVNLGTWVNEHQGKLPNRRSKDPEERSLANWLRNKKPSLVGKIPGQAVEERKILESFGLQRLLEG